MSYFIKDKLNRAQFSFACRRIRETAPLELDPASGLALLSQLQHKDVLMYLLALKSFARRVRPAAVYVLNDGSLTAGDVGLLKRHVPALALLDIADYRSGVCPAGGTWERLLAIAELCQRHYVIQLDADTLATGPLEEVRQCIESGTSFVIGTWDGQDFESMAECCADAKKLNPHPGSHVQILSEANFDHLSGYAGLHYVRGCSGFSGFAKGSFGKGFVEGISREMEGAIGDKWHAWGSEQVMSNIVVANCPQARVLPHPRYGSCQKMTAETVFIHFFGTCRFKNGTYARLGRGEIAQLLAQPTAGGRPR